MNPTPYETKMLEALNDTKVTYGDIAKLVRGCARDHVKGGDNTDLVICKSVVLFEKHPEIGKATYFRLLALAKLMEQDGLRGWAVRGAEGNGTFVNGVVFAATAEQPLLHIDGDIGFDRESFKKRILELAEPKGRA